MRCPKCINLELKKPTPCKTCMYLLMSPFSVNWNAISVASQCTTHLQPQKNATIDRQQARQRTSKDDPWGDRAIHSSQCGLNKLVLLGALVEVVLG